MNGIFERLSQNVVSRISGPMNFRLVLQPIWTTITNAFQRPTLVREAGKDVGKVFILAVVLDAVYQLIAHRGVYLLELLIVAPVLAFLPYILLRGPVTRLVTAFIHRTASPNAQPSSKS